MFDLGQKVLVITENGIAFDAVVVGRAKGDNGPGAYNVALRNSGSELHGQWHKACDVFVAEKTAEEERDSWDDFLKS
jgi:hypothetical protein